MISDSKAVDTGYHAASMPDFVVIDVETTGLDDRYDEIIEIAAIRFTNGKPGVSFTSLIKPQKGLPKHIQYLTHINPEELMQAPDACSVLVKALAFIGDDIIVGHNVNFDIGFVNKGLEKCRMNILQNTAWDTAEISRVYLPFISNHKLSTLAENFGVELFNAHRALADATATGHVLIALVEHILRHYSLMTNARLLDMAKQAQTMNNMYAFLRMIVEKQRRNALSGPKEKMPINTRTNYIQHNIPFSRKLGNEDVFGQNGMLSKMFSGYEFRKGQLDMAELVNQAFSQEHHLAVEAGTGVGKSFAYLVPAISFAAEKKTKVVVSTNTKNLQEQLFYKDLPQLARMVPIPFNASLVKGRENYICERRWQEFLMEQTKGISPYEARSLLFLFVWKLQTQTGDVSENSSFDRSRHGLLWRKVCSDRFQCMGRKCPHAQSCFVMTLRKKIEDSSLVVANHSLLLADTRMDNSTLGEYGYLVVDEAHNLMATAAKHLGFELGYADVINLAHQFGKIGKRKSTGFLHSVTASIAKSLVTDSVRDHILLICNKINQELEEIRQTSTEMFNEAASCVDQAASFGKVRIKDMGDYGNLYKLIDRFVKEWCDLQKDMRALANVLSSVNSKLLANHEYLTETLQGYINRGAETEGKLLMLLSPDLDNYALWIENAPRSEKSVPVSTLCYAPVEVGEQLNDLLYKKVPSIIFTSATLALRGSFKYFYGQSGLGLVPSDKIVERIVESPFDYDSQAKLMIASFLPEHKDKFFQNQALGCIKEILNATNVGTMILFTAYKDLNSVYDYVGDSLYHRDRPFFAQGKAGSRTSILDEFKTHKNAVLLGTSSFWEGVDVQGESLSLLVLYKLPFLVPSEPIVEAFIDKLERDNRDSFMHYMLPNALLRLRQGFGRLIRSKSDRGVVLIMDSRVSNKAYGDYFKKVLPTPCMELNSELDVINEIARFFHQSGG